MREIELVYKEKWIIESIYRESDRLANKVTNTNHFEDRCTKDVAQYLSLDKNNRNNRSHIMYLIKRKVWEAENKFRKEESINFSNLTNENDEEEQPEYEPQDVLTNVESEVMQKETAALLTQGDCRKEMILGYWTIGNTNDKHISRSLTRSMGGNAESHRKYIQRFRKSCRKQLSTAI